MRTEVRIRFDTKDVPGGALAILGPAGCGPDVATVAAAPVLKQLDVHVTLAETDPRAAVLLSLLKEHGVDWSEWHVDSYTEKEIDSAKLRT